MHKYDAIWLTGQPASGKTTLANLLMKELSNSNGEKSYFNIDGDDLRNLFQNKDYSREGRERNIVSDSIQSSAKHFATLMPSFSNLARGDDLRS